MADTVKDWALYEKGKDYNNKIKPYNYYETVDANLNFYVGNQWLNIEANDAPTPVFNYIKKMTAFFVAALTSSKYKIRYMPLQFSDDDNDEDTPEETTAKMATAEVENLFDKIGMPDKIRAALFDAAIMGDACAHIYFNSNKKPYRGAYDNIEGEVCFELVDGTNVFFGNANNPSTDVHIQPYIGITGRDMVENLKEEAKEFKTTDIDSIITDSDNNYLAGDMSDVEIESDEYGKALYFIIYKYDRKTKTVKVSKCTQTAYIYKDIDTGLSIYPVAWMNWERQKNQYHGRALCTDIMDNQIFINKQFAMVMYNLMMTAFPTLIYDADRMAEPTNEIGMAIGLKDMAQGENVGNVAKYLEPGNMSSQIAQILDLVIQITKETLGANDALMGSIDPTKASGRSIIALTENAKVPLSNTEGYVKEWIRTIGDILIDVMAVNYGYRPIIKREDGKQTLEMFDFSKLKQMYLTTKAEVTKKSFYSEYSEQEIIDGLLKSGLIELMDWAKLQEDGIFSKKDDLIQLIESKISDMEAKDQQKTFMYEMMAKFVESQPPEVQAQLQALQKDNPEQFEQQVMQMMTAL